MIIGIACVAILWVSSEPTIRFREFILRGHNGIWRRLLECAMCSGFHIYLWTQLILTHQLQIIEASICSILSEIIYQKLSNGKL